MRKQETPQPLKAGAQMWKGRRNAERIQTDLKTRDWGGKKEMCAYLTGIELALLLREKFNGIPDVLNDVI